MFYFPQYTTLLCTGFEYRTFELPSHLANHFTIRRYQQFSNDIETLYLSDFNCFSQVTVNDKSLENPDIERSFKLFFFNPMKYSLKPNKKTYFWTLKNTLGLIDQTAKSRLLSRRSQILNKYNFILVPLKTLPVNFILVSVLQISKYFYIYAKECMCFPN